LAAESIQKVQQKYKTQYDKKAKIADYRIGDWVMVHFPQEESSALHNLSDHGMALIGFNAVMALMLQWSKCTSLRMVEFKFT